MSYPHKALMAKHQIAVTDLPEKTQKAIAKFESETDEDKREALDEKIFGDVEDFIEDKAAKEKAEKKKAAHAAAKAEVKRGAADVSDVPTAAGAQKKNEQQTPPKERSFTDKLFGRG